RRQGRCSAHVSHQRQGGTSQGTVRARPRRRTRAPGRGRRRLWRPREARPAPNRGGHSAGIRDSRGSGARLRLPVRGRARAVLKALSLRGIPVSRLGIGCMGLAGVYGPVDETAAMRAVHRALDVGINFFDTADVYGNGASERLLARALAGRRHAAVIATEFGNIDHLADQPVAEAFEGRWETNGRPEYVRQACNASLARLGTDHIDLYYLHRVDPAVPIEDTVGAMADLVRVGKVRTIGLSEAGAATVRRAHAVHPIAALQNEYSLWSRDAESGALALSRDLGALFVPHSPPRRGVL